MGGLRLVLRGLLAGLFWGLTVIPAMAHDGDHEHGSATGAVREWRLVGSTSGWSGSYVMATESSVQIRLESGLLRRIAIAELSSEDQQWIVQRRQEIGRLNSQLPGLRLDTGNGPAQRHEGGPRLVSVLQDVQAEEGEAEDTPAVAGYFSAFAGKAVSLRWDQQFLYVESSGMPDHPMMKGIRAWQQQVPLPQDYRGENAWRIPLEPVPAKTPMSAKQGFFRGAIALAVNGVPIFNPIKNDGRTDTLLAGELDEFGGHCGRGDDYHYHVAPVHLEAVAGKGKPVAVALDGYPIFGYQDPDGEDFAPLDPWNGHHGRDGNYHYHATREYPYLNGGFYGEVTERDGQVDPQPRASSPRPALPPLKGATITGSSRSDDGLQFELTYRLRDEERTVRYRIEPGGRLEMEFEEGESEIRRESWPWQQDRVDGRRKPPRPADGQVPLRNSESQRRQPPEDGPAGRPPGSEPQGRAGQPRRPWLEVHAAEMDSDADGILTREEMLAEAERAFAGYDRAGSGEVAVEDARQLRGVRSAMGGFINQHARELDQDEDGKIQQREVTGNAGRMFDKSDPDGDGRITVGGDVPAGTHRGDRGPDRKPAAAVPAGSAGLDAAMAPAGSARDRAPNVILILLDDMGWRDVGFAGNTFVETPNIDRLAREGIQFRQAYASAPNCSPTRACLLSGQYTPRHGVFTVVDPRHSPGQPHHRILAAQSRDALDAKVITIAELLKEREYTTAFLGMWNLGRGRTGPATPAGQGFDIARAPGDFGFAQNAYFNAEGQASGDVLTEEGLQFIEKNRNRSFFLYLALHDVHAPIEPKPGLLAKYQEKAKGVREKVDPAYAAMIEGVDQNVGKIMQKLRALQLDRNTMVIFTSDNGGTPQYVAPLNGSKGALYEGGIRVPCAVWWQGIRNPGMIADDPVLSMDFYPTIAALAGASLPDGQPIDGLNLLPFLKGEQPGLDRESVFWHFPCYVGRGEPASAIRKGDWKLIQKFADDSFELFNLRSDPGETRNLAAEEPAKLRELQAELTRWQRGLAAPVPTERNPGFDPQSEVPGRRSGPRKRRVGNDSVSTKWTAEREALDGYRQVIFNHGSPGAGLRQERGALPLAGLARLVVVPG